MVRVKGKALFKGVERGYWGSGGGDLPNRGKDVLD